jgi:hypothetical protein
MLARSSYGEDKNNKAIPIRRQCAQHMEVIKSIQTDVKFADRNKDGRVDDEVVNVLPKRREYSHIYTTRLRLTRSESFFSSEDQDKPST